MLARDDSILQRTRSPCLSGICVECFDCDTVRERSNVASAIGNVARQQGLAPGERSMQFHGSTAAPVRLGAPSANAAVTVRARRADLRHKPLISLRIGDYCRRCDPGCAHRGACGSGGRIPISGAAPGARIEAGIERAVSDRERRQRAA